MFAWDLHDLTGLMWGAATPQMAILRKAQLASDARTATHCHAPSVQGLREVLRAQAQLRASLAKTFLSKMLTFQGSTDFSENRTPLTHWSSFICSLWTAALGHTTWFYIANFIVLDKLQRPHVIVEICFWSSLFGLNIKRCCFYPTIFHLSPQKLAGCKPHSLLAGPNVEFHWDKTQVPLRAKACNDALSSRFSKNTSRKDAQPELPPVVGWIKHHGHADGLHPPRKFKVPRLRTNLCHWFSLVISEIARIIAPRMKNADAAVLEVQDPVSSFRRREPLPRSTVLIIFGVMCLKTTGWSYGAAMENGWTRKNVINTWC